jgi:hypothetical protein
MKGYAYLDNDGLLYYRPARYIDEENPGFWRDNAAFVLVVWKFDTDDIDSMYRMYSRFKTLKLNNQMVLDFSSGIGFDHKKLSEYASGFQSRPQ